MPSGTAGTAGRWTCETRRLASLDGMQPQSPPRTRAERHAPASQGDGAFLLLTAAMVALILLRPRVARLRAGPDAVAASPTVLVSIALQ